MNWQSRLWNVDEARASGVREGRFLASVAGGQHVDMMIRGVQVSWPEASREEILNAALQARRERLAAVPDLSRYPELEGCRQALEAADEGMCESGHFSPEEMAVCREYIWLIRSRVDESGVLPDSGCTGVFIADSPEGPLAANNLDDWPDGVPVPLPGGPLVNRFGVGLIGVSCGVFLDETTPEIFPAPMEYIQRELCEDVHQALELLTRYNYFWGPTNRLLWDKSGASVVIEKSACRYGIRIGDGYSYTTAMHMETPEMKPFLRERRDEYLKTSGLGFDSIDQSYWLAAEARHHNLARLTQEAAANPSMETVRQIVQSRDGAASLCLHGDKCHVDEERVNWTLATTVWNVNQNRAHCWRMREKDGPPACECEMEEVQFEAPEAVA